MAKKGIFRNALKAYIKLSSLSEIKKGHTMQLSKYKYSVNNNCSHTVRAFLIMISTCSSSFFFLAKYTNYYYKTRFTKPVDIPIEK